MEGLPGTHRVEVSTDSAEGREEVCGRRTDRQRQIPLWWWVGVRHGTPEGHRGWIGGPSTGSGRTPDPKRVPGRKTESGAVERVLRQ